MNHIVTVFCQGNGASRAQAAKYAGPNGLDVLTSQGKKERVYIRDAPLLAHNFTIYPELSDVGHGFTLNPLHWVMFFVHWLVHCYFGVHGASSHHGHITEMNVGGDQDVTEYLQGVRDAIQAYPSKRIVLFGCSRGAATVLIAATRLSDEERRHVALVVAEGPFDTVPHVVNCRARLGGYVPGVLAWWIARLILWLLTRLAKYKPMQQSPLDTMSQWPSDLPVAVVRSRVDDVVAPECTTPLLDKLRERNHPNLHELILEKSPHVNMPNGDANDRSAYLTFTKELYERYCAAI
jgi:pimeloyl-ACP methyl ester carboxylesterase